MRCWYFPGLVNFPVRSWGNKLVCKNIAKQITMLQAPCCKRMQNWYLHEINAINKVPQKINNRDKSNDVNICFALYSTSILPGVCHLQNGGLNKEIKEWLFCYILISNVFFFTSRIWFIKLYQLGCNRDLSAASSICLVV